MKRITLLFILSASTIFGFTQNLLNNGTFEDDEMQLNCKGWNTSFNEPTPLYIDSSNVCMDNYFTKEESNWSLRIFTSFPGPTTLETYITGRAGTQVYQLSYEMKGIGNSIAAIGKYVQGEFELGKQQINNTASNWQMVSLTDTITTNLTDTIVIRLSGDDCDFCPNNASFDNISFSTDITSSIANFENITINKIPVYPNPAKAHITFELNQASGLNHSLYIFNTAGKLVQKIKVNQTLLKINPVLHSGLYYYAVKNGSQQILGSGQFVIE